MSQTLVLCPADPAPAVELAGSGGLWRKRLLPVGDLAYKGRTLHFTPDYLAGLAQAFTANAYDQVPFQLADCNNGHTNDPERFRGAITAMTAEPDGLYITMAPTPEGEQILRTNPRLGVSARIVEDYDRSDGQYFPAAVQHVLGTMDPRIPALGDWEQVALANNPGIGAVYDLSGEEWEIDGQLTDDEMAELEAAADELDALGLLEPDGDDADEATLDEIIADAELEAELEAAVRDGGLTARDEALAEIIAEQAGRYLDQGDLAGAGAMLSEAGMGGIELAGGDFASAFELSQEAGRRESARIAQDAEPLARDDEARLAGLLRRVSAGTYTQQGAYRTAAELANPGAAARELARHRWDEAGAVNGQPTCGPADDLGYCLNAQHAADCGSLADGVTAEALQPYMRGVATEAALDASGKAWIDQHGDAMTMTDHVRASLGVRQPTGSLFEQGPGGGLVSSRPEVPAAQRQVVVGDPDDDLDPGTPFPHSTQELAGRMLAEHILPLDAGADPLRAGQERERVRADPRRVAAVMAAGAGRDAQWDQSGRRALVSARSAGPAVLRDDDGTVLGLTFG